MIHNLDKNRIAADLKASNRDEVLRELAAMVSSAAIGVDSDELMQIILEREELGSTGIGNGIAIPHGKIASLNQIEICFGRSHKGIPFDAHDNKPVHLFFLLLAPTSSTSSYLKCLAQLSRFLKEPETRNNLLKAESREDLLSITASAADLAGG